jgi:4-amino-4-deoxy-L-arabinose transferase-like glycosyltransferase
MTFTTSRRPLTARSADALAAAMDYATASHRRAVALLLAFAFLAFIPGVFQLPVIDREEARAAQATRQMLETGDYFGIRFQHDIQQAQPVGIHWLQAATVKAASAVGVPGAETRIWLYRLPSLLGAVGAVLLTYWAALAFVSRRSALLAAVMLGGSVLLGIEARLAKADAVLLLVATLLMGSLGRAYLRAQRGLAPDRRLAAVFWFALAVGVLLDGLTLVLVAALCIGTLLAADRATAWLRHLFPISGIALFVLLLLPWAAYLALRREQVLSLALMRDLIDTALGRTGHSALPGAYVLLFWVTFWPGAALAGLAAPAVWAARHESGARFLLAWLVPAWIAFELMLSKLPHFVLPLYPAIAVLIAGIIDPHILARTRWLVRGTMWWFVFPALAGVASIAVMMGIGRQLGLFAWPFVAGAMIFGLLAWRLYEVDGAERAVLRAVIAALFLTVGVFGVMLPMLNVLFPSATLAQAVRTRECPRPMVAAAGFHEPSLVFQFGTETRLTDASGAADFLRGGSCRVAIVEARHERSFAIRAEGIGLRYAAGPRVETYNFNAGRWMTLAVYHSEEER